MQRSPSADGHTLRSVRAHRDTRTDRALKPTAAMPPTSLPVDPHEADPPASSDDEQQQQQQQQPPVVVPPTTLDALGDDTILLILRRLARPSPAHPQTPPQALARTAQCSRRLQRLVENDSLWAELCRSEFPHSRLPTAGGTGVLQRCFAERVTLPLRLASELDHAIGGLRRLVELQSAGKHTDASSWSVEPAIYSSSGLDRRMLVSLPRAGEDSDDTSTATPPSSQPTLETLVMYRFFRVGLGLNTLAKSTVPDDAGADAAAAAAPANEQLRLLLEDCDGLLRDSIRGSQHGAGSGGWIAEWCGATQRRLQEFDPWGQGTLNWPDIPWRRSALAFVLQFFGQTVPRSTAEPEAEPEGTAWVAAVRDQVESSFDTMLQELREEGEDLSLPRRWVPLGLPRQGPEAAAHEWWFEPPPDEVALASHWGNRC